MMRKYILTLALALWNEAVVVGVCARMRAGDEARL